MNEHDAVDWILDKIGTTNRYCVEFGIKNGMEEVTTPLVMDGWHALYIERDEHRYREMMRHTSSHHVTCLHRMINAENVNDIFAEAAVPDEFDVLSIDVDGMDYWIWKALRYRPRAVIIEYNATKPPDQLAVIPYDPDFAWNHDRWFGASLLSLTNLGKSKGYELVGTHDQGVTAYYVRSDLFPLMNIDDNSVQTLYNKASYGGGPEGGHGGNDGEYLAI